MHHLAELAEKCGELPASFFRFQVVELWVFGELLDVPKDVDVIEVALVTDLPVDEVAWLTEPVGAEHWANSTRLSRNPFTAFWRSQDAPVWNHRIERPALIWSAADGINEEVLVAVSDAQVASVHLASLGAFQMPRSAFVTHLADACARSFPAGSWRERWAALAARDLAA